MKRGFVLAVLVGAMLPIAVFAATETPADRTPIRGKAAVQGRVISEEEKSRSSAARDVIEVNVLVADQEGRAIPGLKRENFRPTDNGAPQTIANFSPTTAPITIAMLMEYSSSGYNYYAARSASWAVEFMDELEPRDWVALITYDVRATVRVDFTHNRPSVRDAILSLGSPSFREANSFDALLETLDRLEPVRGRTAILLLSTGANSFSAATLDEVLQRLKATNVTVFSVGLAEQEYIRRGGSNIGYVQARSWLQSFADLTGGVAYFPRFQGELPEIFRSIAAFLRSEYTLGFVPSQQLRDGKLHRLKVQVVGADGMPLTVKDKKGREREVTVFARTGYRAPVQ